MNKGRLDSIQVLRGVAALLVVLFHFRHFVNDVYPLKDLGDRLFLFGEAGVDLFFIISGFIIVYSSKNREKNTFSEFAIKRFFRLYPIYFVVLTFYLISYGDEVFTISNIIKSYLLIPIDFNGKGPWFGLSTIYTAWTLSYEAYFYIIFSIAIFVNHKYRALVCAVAILLIMVISQLHLYDTLFLDPITAKKDNQGVLYNLSFVSSPLIIDFILGMFLAYLYDYYDKKCGYHNIYNFIAFSSMAIALIFMISSKTGSVGPTSWGWCSFLIVASMLVLTKNLNLTYPRFLISIGEMSYSIYINHVVVKKVSFAYIGSFGLFTGKDGFFILFSLVVVTLCISYFTYTFIEKPSVKLGHKLADRIRLKRQKAAE
ncbi:acyltransferase family protein [Yersinia rochesterensis]|uniref:Acyltransferase family protein n=1 Tax=Yersinia rochesterensis TaxID=1604335 RepID=A0ABM5SMH7_9GAMM|nr:acyltransferase family protein [Yersinia frederiksenii Y225]AJJ35720.1 acyltransferase family protein [Yersinia rochesterensis]